MTVRMNDADIAAVRTIATTYLRRAGEGWADHLTSVGRMHDGKRTAFIDEFVAGALENVVLNQFVISVDVSREEVLQAMTDLIRGELDSYSHITYIRYPLEEKYAPRQVVVDPDPDPVDEGLDDDAACCESNSLEGIITTMSKYFATGKIIYVDAEECHG